MLLAGIPIPIPTASSSSSATTRSPLKLEDACGREIKVFGLSEDDRDAIILALDDSTEPALAELRGVLLREHMAA